MLKVRFTYSFILFFLLISLLPIAVSASTNTINGTIEEVVFEVTVDENERVTKEIKQLRIRDQYNIIRLYSINSLTRLTIDNIPVEANAFKQGMKISALARQSQLVILRGYSTKHEATIEFDGKQRVGIVTQLDSGGHSLVIRDDYGVESTYYLNDRAVFYKANVRVDRSKLFVGDEVKLLFSEYNSSYPTSIHIQTQGAKIENLYRGDIFRIDPVRNIVILKDVEVFRNWAWQSFPGSNSISFPYDSSQTIYLNNQEVHRDNLRLYENNQLYFVTKKEFNQEVIARMIIKDGFETTKYEPIRSINLTQKFIGMGTNNQLHRYHEGTIIIRNDRIVEDTSILVPTGHGQAFLHGITPERSFVNILYMVNDGLSSPNLTENRIYYGRLTFVGSNQLQISGSELKNNQWDNRSSYVFRFDNDSKARRDINVGTVTIMPNEFSNYQTRYGYFYIVNNRVETIHFLESFADDRHRANLVSSGRIDAINSDRIDVKNVSRWQGSRWVEMGLISGMDIKHVTIIKNGKLIEQQDLQLNDRVYILHESPLKGRFLIVE